MSITLNAIRNCLDGVIPAVIATCAADGIPNVAYLSQVHFVDDEHVALTFQFFNRTRANILANPRAIVQVVDPDTVAHYLLSLQYLRTETEGPLFENMKAKLAGIASHTGMSKVFRLLGSDIYRVLAIEAVPCAVLPCLAPPRNLLPALRNCTRRLTACNDMAALLDQLLVCLETQLQIPHALLLMLDETGGRLYTVASHGYARSGVGWEIALGEGVIGVAARERTPIRITHMAQEYIYSRAVRQNLPGEAGSSLETEIPFPGLTQPRSQLAVPIMLADELLGVLYVESPKELQFTYEHEDALAILASQLALAIDRLEQTAELQENDIPEDQNSVADTGGETIVIRYYPADNSVFVGNDYLIKGVAGAICWKLLRDYAQHQRTEFSNRELRLDPDIRLPDITHNLEARLILLQRRLQEYSHFLRIEKSGRGLFSLHVERPIKLTQMPAAARR